MIAERIDTLVVAEKPGVARAFAEFLSDDKYREVRLKGVRLYVFRRRGEVWVSIGLRGHVMDFDFPKEYNKWRSIDPRRLFFVDPIRVVRRESRRYARLLVELGRRARHVVLAPDADVEGESIAFEVMSILRRANPRLTFERVWFNAVTPTDIKRALERPRDPDPRLANKAFARMIVDLTIGAAFTRALTLSVEKRGVRLPRGKFLSYGPCQTPVLFLVVKRALERENFKKRKYYVVEATLRVDGYEFKTVHEKGRFDEREPAEEVAERVSKQKKGVVEESEYRHKEVSPPVPLTTVELERRASSYLNIRSKDALNIAEDLYQEGLISYPRTDTNIYPPTLNLRSLASQFLAHPTLSRFVRREILSRPKIVPTSGKEDDKAHPPIYPTRYADEEYVKKRFGEKGWKLYDLVIRHFLATLGPPAVKEDQRVTVNIGGERFIATGLKVVDDGYYEVYPYERPQESPLPYLVEGDEVEVVEVRVVERETKPPPYLSEAELLRLMKKYGIGTDATMQDHIHTNLKRKYFVIRKKRCVPTPLGKALAVTLFETVPEIVLPEVRGKMERELSLIARGEREPREVVSEVKERFLEYFDRLMSREEVLASRLTEALRQVYGEKAGARSRARRASSRRGRK